MLEIGIVEVDSSLLSVVILSKIIYYQPVYVSEDILYLSIYLAKAYIKKHVSVLFLKQHKYRVTHSSLLSSARL